MTRALVIEYGATTGDQWANTEGVPDDDTEN